MRHTNAGIVDQDVDTRRILEDSVGRAPHRCMVGQITLHEKSLDRPGGVFSLDVSQHGVDVLLGPRHDDDLFGRAARQRRGDGASDAPSCGAGDDKGATVCAGC